MRRTGRIGACALGLVLLAPAVAVADDGDLADAHRTLYRNAEAAAAGAGGSEGTQGAYDAARDLQEALRRSAPVSAPCRPLLSALRSYAGGRVRQMEGIDRPSAADVAAGRRIALRSRSQVAAARPRCGGSGGGATAGTLPISPSAGEVFYGAVVARAPAGADAARIYDGGTPGPLVGVRGGRARFSVSWAPGLHDVRVVFLQGSRTLGSSQSRGAWLLRPSARRMAPGSRTDAGLAAELSRALAGGPRYRAAWIQDLRNGRTAGVNAGAAFPAASTVKLGLLAGVLARSGARPEASRYAYDLRAMTTWSSNLATNRLLRRFGGVPVATDGLRRLGARTSTFTGEYIVGTELQPNLPPAVASDAPPRVSARVTSAQDLARMLFAIHASALSPRARRESGLTVHQARLALGWLLSSQQRGDNASLLSGGVTAGTPLAQKNGWLRAARHAAGVVYAPGGPVIVVLLTYDGGGVGLARARAVGARVARAATR